MTRPLKIGIFISAMNGGMKDGALGWRDLHDMATRSEQIGFDSFWIPDHLIFKHPDQPVHGPWECWSLIAALAATTTRMELGSLVSCISFRNPGLMAKMADTIEEISGGRLILGLGAGWHEPEYQAFGYPFDHRFERFDEAATVITSLLRTSHADFHGDYYTLNGCELRPRGPRPSGPPIMIGALANRPRMLGLAVKHADIWNGWLLNTRSDISELAPMRDAVDLACEKAGRDPVSLERSVGIGVDQRPAAEIGTGMVPGAVPMSGEPEAIADQIRQFAEQGISHIQIAPMVQGVAGLEALVPVLESLDAG